ncbi:sugar transporter ERD6-like 5 isoform X2 [Quercus robur]|uniref:sugar transporter ERD6-like 5 isoform X2 n=1 Tax=Quercus robur TaxID=38942 RepID=UPI002163D4B3|nr:sugar transporter ERD6-like 5 isoform X2 [Quercus robur]
MEDEVVRKSLLVKQEASSNTVDNGNGHVGDGANTNGGATVRPSDSSATAILVISTIVAACGAFTGGSVAVYSSLAENGIIADLGLTVAEYSLFGSIMTIGAIIGALISGKMTDVIGRRYTFWILDIFYIMGWLSIIFAKGAWLLDLGRLLLGVGFGITCYVGPVYLAEITPKNLRGGFMSITQSMTGYGSSLTYLIGSIISWRTLAIIGSIPCILMFLGLFLIPESPRWLVKIGKQREFEAALQRLRGVDADTSQEASDIKDYTDNLQQNSDDKIQNLFQRKYVPLLIVGVGLMLVQVLGGLYGFLFYMSEIFNSAGISSTVGYIVLAVTLIPSIFLGASLIDKVGRRMILMVSAMGNCLGCFLTGLAYLLQDHNWWKGISHILALVGVLVYMGSYSFGMVSIPWIIVSEIFPINVKGSAGTLCNLVNWFASFFVSYTFNFLFKWSSAGTFFIYSSICGLGVLFIAKLVPETKGRTLEEIQSSLTGILQ